MFISTLVSLVGMFIFASAQRYIYLKKVIIRRCFIGWFARNDWLLIGFGGQLSYIREVFCIDIVSEDSLISRNENWFFWISNLPFVVFLEYYHTTIFWNDNCIASELVEYRSLPIPQYGVDHNDLVTILVYFVQKYVSFFMKGPVNQRDGKIYILDGLLVITALYFARLMISRHIYFEKWAGGIRYETGFNRYDRISVRFYGKMLYINSIFIQGVIIKHYLVSGNYCGLWCYEMDPFFVFYKNKHTSLG